MIVLAVLLNSPVSGEDTRLVMRPNYGVVFQKVAQVDNAAQYWQHTFQILLPQPILPEMNHKCVRGRSDTTCPTIQSVIQGLRNLRESSLMALQDFEQEVLQLIPETKTPNLDENIDSKSRVSRDAFLPFVGSFLKGAFGTATSEDVMTLQDHMQAMITKTNQVVHAFQGQSGQLNSFMTTQDKRIENIMNSLEETNSFVHKVTTYYNASIHTLEDQVQTMFYLLAKEVQINENLKARIAELKLAIYTLLHNQLPSSLIPPPMLLETLKNISITVANEDPLFEISNWNIDYYYKTSNILLARFNYSLFVTLKVPLSSSNIPFDVYETLVFPVPLNHTTDHTTEIRNFPKYFAISPDQQYYSHIAPATFEHCYGQFRKHCPTRFAQTLLSDFSCASAMFLDQQEQIKQLCIFDFVQNGAQTSMRELEPGKVLLTNITEIILTCQGKIVSKSQGCMFCILDIPCKCAVRANHVQIPPRIGHCYPSGMNPKLVYPVNLALLNHFFSPSALENMGSNTTFDQPLDIKIPPFQIFEHNISSLVSNDIQDRLNLQHMIQRAKDNEAIFQTLSDPIYSGEWIKPTKSFWQDYQQILLSISSFFAIVATIFSIYLYFKMRMLTASFLAFSLATQPRPTQAVSTVNSINQLIWYPYTPSMPTEQNTTPVVTLDDLMTILSLILLLNTITFLMILFLVIQNYFRKQEANKHQLMLALSDESQNLIKLSLMPLALLCQPDWKLVGTKMPDSFKVNKVSWKRFLTMETHGLKLKHIQGNETMVPNKIRLTWVEAIRIKALLKTEFTVHYCIQYGYRTTFLQGINRDDTTIPEPPTKPTENEPLYSHLYPPL